MDLKEDHIDWLKREAERKMYLEKEAAKFAFISARFLLPCKLEGRTDS